MFYQDPLFWGAAVLAFILGYSIKRFLASQKAASLEAKADRLLEEAKKQAEEIVAEAKKHETEAKKQIARLEERLLSREEALDRRTGQLENRWTEIENGAKKLEEVKKRSEEAAKEAEAALEKAANLSAEEAKKELLQKIRKDYQEELAAELQKINQERKEEIEKKSLEIITTALYRYARSHVADLTTATVSLPSDELKGKIIGREGRNIRALERLTGVEVVIDETPESLVISSFDPVRREIAKMALEKLIKDGRIQPAKIEEKVEEARAEINKKIQEYGEAAAYELGIIDLPKEIVQLLGRLHFRTSFGQNVLVHSIEMAHLSGMMAAELGANAEVAKKGALLHDIGKAIDHEVQGTHVELGRKILKKYGIDEAVIAAMQSHHEDYPFASPEAYIVTAADVLSAARPGARRGTLENYIKRLEDLEKIANSFEGVKNSYAISAGRELRVFVVPEKIDDFGALELAKNIAGKIESEMKYPGEIKVNVIRETRAVEYAK